MSTSRMGAGHASKFTGSQRRAIRGRLIVALVATTAVGVADLPVGRPSASAQQQGGSAELPPRYSGSSFCRGFLRALAKGDLTEYGFGFVPNRPTNLATAAKRCVQGAAVEGAVGAFVGAGTGAAYGAGFGMVAAPGPGGAAGAAAGAGTGAARGFLVGAGSGCATAVATKQRVVERVPR